MKLINYLLIIGIIISLILVTGCTNDSNINQDINSNRDRNMNITLDPEIKAEVESVFSQDLESIENYCFENQKLCVLYCREIEDSHEFCNNIRGQMSENKGERPNGGLRK